MTELEAKRWKQLCQIRERRSLSWLEGLSYERLQAIVEREDAEEAAERLGISDRGATMTFGSMYAGIGGFDLGFERAGLTCKWQIENDPYCLDVLAKHWSDVPRHGDIRGVMGADLKRVDVVCGGFPCQGLSVAGKRKGLADERSGLFWHLVRLVSELRPEWLVLENVPGLLSSNGGRDMEAVVGAVLDAGYSCAWRVLDSQWFGVAQRRRRIFIVGHSDPGRAGAVLFEPEGGAGHPAAVRKTGTDVAHCLDARTGGVSGKENSETLVACLKGAAIGRKPEAGPQRGEWRQDGKSYTINTTEQHAVAYALNAHGGSHGRIDGESETFVGAPPDADRVREAPGLPRRLDGRRYKAMGNAVTVQVAEWIGRRLMKVCHAAHTETTANG